MKSNVAPKTASIISFPKSRISREVTTETAEDVLTKANAAKMQHAAELTQQALQGVYNRLELEGFDMESDQFDMDFGFVHESLLATVLRANGIFYPMQEIIDDVFAEQEPEANTANTETTTTQS